jgi:Kef-type K+ transport system membrane component KefB
LTWIFLCDGKATITTKIPLTAKAVTVVVMNGDNASTAVIANIAVNYCYYCCHIVGRMWIRTIIKLYEKTRSYSCSIIRWIIIVIFVATYSFH